MAKTKRQPMPVTAAQQRTLTKQLREFARNRSTSLEWYYSVGKALRELAPKSTKRSIEGYAVDIFKSEKFKTTLYACRRFAEVLSATELSRLKGLNWAIVHHLIYADDRHRLMVVRRLQAARRRKERRGERLTPLEARLIVQEISGKSSVRRAKQSKVPELGPKSALRETARLSADWVRYCETWLAVVAAENARRASRARLPSDNNEWESLLRETTMAIKNMLAEAKLQLRVLR